MAYRTITITSIKELCNCLEKDEDKQYYYRGQANADWLLVPSVFRGGEKTLLHRKHINQHKDFQGFFESFVRIEEDIYKQINHHLVGDMGQKSAWEKICYAQHYRFPTRLLDWTINRLVALYFLASGECDCDGALWCYQLSDDPAKIEDLPDTMKFLKPFTTAVSEDSENPIFFEDDATSVVTAIQPPPDLDLRVEKQESIFLVRFTSKAGEMFIDQEWELGKKSTQLLKVVIPASLKKEIIEYLSEQGINEDFIYPPKSDHSDLEVAKHEIAKQREIMLIKEWIGVDYWIHELKTNIEQHLDNHPLRQWVWHPNGKFELTLHYQEQEYAVFVIGEKPLTIFSEDPVADIAKQVQAKLLEQNQLDGTYQLEVEVSQGYSSYMFGLEQDEKTHLVEQIVFTIPNIYHMDNGVYLDIEEKRNTRVKKIGQVKILKKGDDEDKVTGGIILPLRFSRNDTVLESQLNIVESQLQSLIPHPSLPTLLIYYNPNMDRLFTLYAPHIRELTQGFKSVFVKGLYNDSGFVKDEIFGVTPTV